MDDIACATVEKADNETADLDFKAAFDPNATRDWCELIKDIVAMANSGGGIVVFGVNDDGTPAPGGLNVISMQRFLNNSRNRYAT